LAAARNPQIAGELELVYEHIAREAKALGPVCNASGRCCNFDAWGHRLYVTGLEAAYLLARLDIPLTGESITSAKARGGCPFQIDRLCSVHAIRPLGCRVYYCDERAKLWQEQLSERMLSTIKSIHDNHNLPYRYGEWREMLNGFVDSSHLPER